MARVDYEKQSAVFDRGRQLTPETIAAWMVAARRHVDDDADRVLDLGSGTGRFSAVLTETFDADVVGVEPSRGMRDRAATKPHPRVHVVAGAAEHLPLRSESCDIAWLSNVIHHFDDLQDAARELRRVVTGPVLIRGTFGGRTYELPLTRFWPEGTEIIDSFPTLTETTDAFEGAGFSRFFIEPVTQVTAHSYADAYEAAKLRADTALEKLSDEAFERGLARLARAAREESGPMVDTFDLLVVR
jgi:SAM-dependent methyltransferase